MINKLSLSKQAGLNITYPALNPSLSFAQYLKACREMIANCRGPLQASSCDYFPDVALSHIVETNSPYELYPVHPMIKDGKHQYGALLIHGLLDCPFSLKEIGSHLQTEGILCKSILLPGHGTLPDDLISVSYRQWIEAVSYGIESMRKEVDQLFLIGYSTGAALSICHALQQIPLAGLVLLSPAIQVKMPIDMAVAWHHLVRRRDDWLFKQDEIDYAKYLSIPVNAVNQVTQLTAINQTLNQQQLLDTPMLMILSQQDETISSSAAIRFFKKQPNPHSTMLLYSASTESHRDARIEVRSATYPELSIKHFSHIAVPFSQENFHYGQQGDYPRASRLDGRQRLLGAYNRLEVQAFDFLYEVGAIKQQRKELTYNPDFNYMIKKILNFITEAPL